MMTMGGAGMMQAANQSLTNNRGLLNKKRLKDHPYLKASSARRRGTADYEELKAWRLLRESHRRRSRITAFITSFLVASTALFFILRYLP